MLWADCPSPAHFVAQEAIEGEGRKILGQAGSGERLIVGTTEDVPNAQWHASYAASHGVLRSEGRLPLSCAG